MAREITFNDGAAYERMMGTWSRLVGRDFLDWAAPQKGLRWLDVGCGSGSFTELILQRCSPAKVSGVDPSAAQLAFARARAGGEAVDFQVADAMRLPFQDGSFDATVAALVLFFLEDPAKGLAEMVRVTAPGGLVCAYLWDIPTGLPHFPITRELRAAGLQPPVPPSAAISDLDALRALFEAGGLEQIETKVIVAEREFADFDDWWDTSLLGSSLTAAVQEFGLERIRPTREKLRADYAHEGAGPIRRTARAHAIKAVAPRR